ncbi:MerR family transcriptional regulator [Microaerobacter geothermalis]|uniref:MerR family transcriptional regulator n=1 Tax=Microaerobacter geothermalis TaxID=674972 RepID=UPI001F219149|nr:MerR family transcriptional regulator [Microaerobacter geothermalis]MCF6093796.1 MerR family transcriptional regulator [Microaerobacter geothermalis]
MIINEVAKKLNISPRAIRFYEEKGLINPDRRDNNQYRTFTEKEVWRLQTIIALREVGMGLDDIKKVLGQVELGNKDELLYYLELQRSVMFSTWLEYKQQIITTDRMIEILKQEQALSLNEIVKLAEGSKRIREIRNNWSDKWNFDYRASNHDHVVKANDGLYKNYDQALDTIYKLINPKDNEVGLDIGTGTGNLAGRFISHGYKMAAIDQSKEMLKLCQSKFPQLETRLGNFLAIPYLDDHFDFAVSSFALHHLTDEQKLLALEEIRRVLKPKGRICLADFMFEDEFARQKYLEVLHNKDNQDLIKTIEDKHFSIVSHISDWFENNGYITKQKQLSDVIHIVYAVPIR